MKPLKTVLFFILLGIAAAVCLKHYMAEMPLQAEDGHYTAEQAKIHLEARGITQEAYSAKQLEAAAAGDTELLALLVAAQPGSMVRDENHNTALHISAKAGQKAACDLLATSYQAVMSTNNRGQTPLHMAAENGHTACAELLLQRKANINLSANNGYTPLLSAIKGGHTECAVMLLQAGASPYSRTGDGQTALQLAATQPQILAKLEEAIQAHAEQKQPDTAKNDYLPTVNLYSGEPIAKAIHKGNTTEVKQLLADGLDANHRCDDKLPLVILATSYNNPQALKLLLEAGADANAKAANGENALYTAIMGNYRDCATILLEYHATPNTTINGRSPLIIATENRQAHFIQSLLNAGALINKADANGETPLITAARIGYKEGIQLLLAAGADINQASQDVTALLAAVLHRQEACTELLITQGADITYSLTNKRTAIHCAAEKGAVACAKLLLKAGADVDAADSQLNTPLHLAAQNGHRELVRLLLTHGANPNAQNADSASAMHLAAQGGAKACITALAEAGAALELTLPNGCTPLLSAAHAGQEDSLKALLAAGANSTATDESGASAIDIATRHRHHACVQLLATENLKQQGIITVNEESLISAIQQKNNSSIPLFLAAHCHFGNAAIYTAAATGNHEALKQLLNVKGNWSTVHPPAHQSPLHAAAAAGSTACTRLLILHHIPLNSLDSDNKTAYEIAKSKGHTECAEVLECAVKLAERGYTVSEYNKGLIDMASKGDHITLTRLLNVGADANTKDKNGSTALHKAAALRSVTCVKKLLEAGAPPNVLDKSKLSPLMVAVQNNRSSAVRALLNAGADPDLMGDTDNALTYAIQEKRTECLQILLAAGADVNSSNSRKQSLLQLAIVNQSPQMVELLLKHGADIQLNDRGEPLIFTIIRESSAAILKIVLDSDRINLNCTNQYGASPIHIAAECGNIEALVMLVKNGVRIDKQDYEGLTLMHYAARAGQTAMIQQLLANNIKASVPDKKDRTPLFYAEQAGHTECARLLKEAEQKENFNFTMPK